MDTKEPVTRGPDRPFEPDHWDLGKVQTMPWNVEYRDCIQYEKHNGLRSWQFIRKHAEHLLAIASVILLIAASFILGMEFGR